MSKVNVTIIDVTGNKEQEAALPDDAPVRRIISKLIQMMNMPAVGPDGQPMSYKFVHKASGRQIADEQTLADANVKDGDVLRLQPEITAGSREGLLRNTKSLATCIDLFFLGLRTRGI